MARTKYIVLPGNGNLERMIIFDEQSHHSDIAKQFIDKPVSAGFVKVTAIDGRPKALTYGESMSLKVGSRPQDERIANYLLGIGQYYDP